mgnify:CR=1 FL=1
MLFPIDGASQILSSKGFTSDLFIQKVEIDSFSGYKIYPSKGKLFVRGDSKVCLIHPRQIPSISPRYQVFRFAGSKNASLFMQRKNPRKIAWTVVYRKMHKKGITEEVAKKRSRKTVKHQRGIVGADLATIAARRNLTEAARAQARAAAIAKAKAEKKEKEAKKAKVRYFSIFFRPFPDQSRTACCPPLWPLGTQGVEATNEGWQGRTINAITIREPSLRYCILQPTYISLCFLGSFKSHRQSFVGA